MIFSELYKVNDDNDKNDSDESFSEMVDKDFFKNVKSLRYDKSERNEKADNGNYFPYSDSSDQSYFSDSSYEYIEKLSLENI